jgi:hypothetical protein
MRGIGVAERRARVGVRHRLALRGGAVEEVVRSVVALHATDPASVFLAAWARLADPSHAAVETALYEERSLVRMLGMRRTMFVVPLDLAPVVQTSCTDAIAAKQRKLLVQHLESAALNGDLDGWLRRTEEAAHRALLARGEATGAQLGKDEPLLRTQIDPFPDKSYAKPGNITNRVLGLLAAEGRIVRGRPLGSWISSQYRWSPVEAWLPGGMPAVPAAEARVELVRRWLAAFGPGTVADLKWWTGWTAGDVKKALASIGPAEVDMDGVAGFVLPSDLEPVEAPPPWAALLPALDPSAMGWQERGWYLGEHGPALFDRTGNIGPSIWWNGRIVGGWAQRPDGEVAVRLLEDAGCEASAAIDAEASRLTGWLGDVRVTPRFRTPLERELAA